MVKSFLILQSEIYINKARILKLMAISQARPRRKQSGARYKAYRKKRQHELGRNPSNTGINKNRIAVIRTMGGHRKLRLLSSDIANLFDPKEKKYYQVKIKSVVDNPANTHFIRRNIMTKGAVIDTEKGKAKITSRPGQHGVINAVLIS